MISERIICAICHTDINDPSQVFQSTLNYGLICRDCIKKFSEEEIEVVLNLFILYGGYFGKHARTHFSVITKLLEIVEKEGEEFDLEKTNMKLLHEALTHGITPREFNKSLEGFLKD
jgi:hypothetical protein